MTKRTDQTNSKMCIGLVFNCPTFYYTQYSEPVSHGGVAQMVERPLSMREVPGSIPGISRLFCRVKM